MTAVLASHPPSWATSSKGSDYYAMSPDQTDSDWRQQYYHQINTSMPLLSSSWAGTVNPSISQAPSVGGMTEVDLRMFQQSQRLSAAAAHHDHTPQYDPNLTYPGASQLISPTMAYGSEATWSADMDMSTPSTANFPPDLPEGFHQTLRLPSYHNQSNQSPHSSIDDFSPHPGATAGILSEQTRPGIYRAVTAPSHHRTVTATTVSRELNNGSLYSKRSEPSEDGDDLPSAITEPARDHRGSTASTASALSGAATTTTRGRKRTRIPHTAVERRYRENLNAHLDQLRLAVPAFNQPQHIPGGNTGPGGVVDELATAGPSTNDGGAGATVAATGMRPSKCEILNGAIEHIRNLDKDVNTLKAENEALRTRLAEVEQWYLQHQVGPSGRTLH